MKVELGEDDRHHLENVLRLDAGDRIVVSDGQGRSWPAVIVDGGRVRLTSEADRRTPRRPRLHVLQGLPKRKKFEEVVRSLVELGVETITPVTAERSVRRLSTQKRRREQRRWQAVAGAAASQSRRSWLAEIAPVTTLAGALGDLGSSGATTGVIAHPAAGQELSPSVLDEATDSGGEVIDGGVDATEDPGGEFAVAVGPEGGWTDAEVRDCVQAGLIAVSLGDCVLRTEHAAFAVCAVLSYAFGRLGGSRPDIAVSPGSGGED